MHNLLQALAVDTVDTVLTDACIDDNDVANDL
jgi:hypothetical protein